MIKTSISETVPFSHTEFRFSNDNDLHCTKKNKTRWVFYAKENIYLNSVDQVTLNKR